MNKDQLLATFKANWPVALFAVLTVHLAFLVFVHVQDGAGAFFGADHGFFATLAMAPVRSMGPAATYVLLLALLSLCVLAWMGREIDNLPRRSIGLPLLLLGTSGLLAVTSDGRTASGILGDSLEWGFESVAGSAAAAVICVAIFAYGLLMARDWFFFDRIREWIDDASPALAADGVGMPTDLDDDVRPAPPRSSTGNFVSHRTAEPGTTRRNTGVARSSAIPMVDLSDVDEADVEPIRSTIVEPAPTLDSPDDDLLLARLSSEISEADPATDEVVTAEVAIVEVEPEADADDDLVLENENDEFEFEEELAAAEAADEFQVMTVTPPLTFADEVSDATEIEADDGGWETVEVDLDFGSPDLADETEEVEAAEAGPAAAVEVELEDELIDDEEDEEFGLGVEVHDEEDLEEDEEEASLGYDEDEEDDEDYELEAVDDTELEEDDDAELEEDDDENLAEADGAELEEVEEYEYVDADDEDDDEGEFDQELIASYSDEEDADDEDAVEEVEPTETQQFLFGEDVEELEDEDVEEVEIVAEDDIAPDDFAEETIELEDEDDYELVDEDEDDEEDLVELEAEEEDDEDPAGEAAEPTLLDYAESASAIEPAPAAPTAEDWAAWDDAPEFAAPAAAAAESAPRASQGDGATASEVDDEAFRAAVAACVEQRRCSVSILQRSLGMTFPAASACIERMEAEGIVGPYRGSGVREILSVPEGYASEEA